jgi:hypothetical protein
MKRFHILLFLFIIGLLLPSLSSLAENRIKIVLKNGGVVRTDEYFEENGQICTYRYGTLIRIPKSNISKIQKTESFGDVEEVTPDQSLFQEQKHEQAGSSRSASGQNKKHKRSIGTKSVSKQESKEDECKRKLQIYHTEVKIKCGDADYKASHIPRAPNIPPANVTYVSKETADQFTAHVKAKAAAYKAQRNCTYYKDMVEYWEKKCGK